jgi:hypothetical protein
VCVVVEFEIDDGEGALDDRLQERGFDGGAAGTVEAIADFGHDRGGHEGAAVCHVQSGEQVRAGPVVLVVAVGGGDERAGVADDHSGSAEARRRAGRRGCAEVVCAHWRTSRRRLAATRELVRGERGDGLRRARHGTSCSGSSSTSLPSSSRSALLVSGYRARAAQIATRAKGRAGSLSRIKSIRPRTSQRSRSVACRASRLIAHWHSVVHVKYLLLSEEPVPVWVAVTDPCRRPPPGADEGPVFDAFAQGCDFRGVSIDRLPSILRFGIDVQPTDAPIYVGEFEKAWEYGEFPKVVMALDVAHAKPTFRGMQDDVSQGELDELRAIYPYSYRVDDQTWLSRIDDPNPAVRGYEAAYARWIPGDPFGALRGVFVYVSAADLEHLRQMTE